MNWIKLNNQVIIKDNEGKYQLDKDKEALNRVKCLNLEYPQSKILAKVNISNCIELTKEINKSIIKEKILIYGNKEDRTGYAWKITKVEKIKNENLVLGKLGL